MDLATKRGCGSWVGLAAATVVIAATVIACPLPRGAMAPVETPYMAENHAAMATMMVGMAIKPSGDVDRDSWR